MVIPIKIRKLQVKAQMCPLFRNKPKVKTKGKGVGHQSTKKNNNHKLLDWMSIIDEYFVIYPDGFFEENI